MDMIHALGASVSMATGGAKAVQGGNWRIFEAMLKNASATMHLGTTVSRVSNPLYPAECHDEYGS
jgi:prenylcysteine oxidase/farnesylcysteine lyase